MCSSSGWIGDQATIRIEVSLHVEVVLVGWFLELWPPMLVVELVTLNDICRCASKAVFADEIVRLTDFADPTVASGLRFDVGLGLVHGSCRPHWYLDWFVVHAGRTGNQTLPLR